MHGPRGLQEVCQEQRSAEKKYGSVRRSEVTTDIPTLESPIDVMYLIHKALRAEAARVEMVVDQLEEGSSLHPFKQAFYGWVIALGHHAAVEDTSMTALLPDSPPARENEAAHRRLEERLEDVQKCLYEEIGRTLLIARTQRHLYGRVVRAQIAQDDHLEEEEAFVLPLIRQRLGEAQQLEIARRLLLDQDAEDTRWILDWVAQALTPTEQQWLAGLAARFTEVFPRAS
jgi:hemerythrin-like domain-containing protein